MVLKTLAGALALILLAGCAQPITTPPLNADEPGSPVAGETPLPPRSHTLAIDDTSLSHAVSGESSSDTKPEMGEDRGHMQGMHHHMSGMHGETQHGVATTQSDETAPSSELPGAPRTVPATSPASPPVDPASSAHEHHHGGTEQ